MAVRPRDSLFCLILACGALPAGALAAELGEARVASHLGQQLVADIELTGLRDEAAPVQVRLASADVYRGAGVAVPPVLAGLNLSVTRRGGRQFVHATTQGQVQAEYLHLYLELAEGNERSVRLVTLWFTPDPNPAPPPVVRPMQPVAAVAAVAVPKLSPQPEPKPAPVAESKTVPQAKFAPKVEPKPVTEAKPAPKAEPKPVAEAKPAPKADVNPAPPVKPAPKPAPTAKPAPEPGTVAAVAPAAKTGVTAVPVPKAQPVQVPRPAPAVHLPLAAAQARALASPVAPLKAASAPSSCPQPNPALLKACVALDYKNAQLTAQIGQLEDKVKVLQLAMGRAPATVSAPPLARTVAPAGRMVPHVVRPRKPAAPPEPEFPWFWLAAGGAVLLAGAGAATFAVRRRRAEQERKARALKATLPPVMGSVKNRLKSGKGAEAGVEADAELARE
ncbi:MAG TPA: hypothetical protein VF861_08855 [Telluria sp.]